MMELTSSNYFSLEANREYWSVSQFKAFNECEACALAQANGEYERELTDSLLIGSYVDAYFSTRDEWEQFQIENEERMFTKKGDLYAKFQHANDIINRIEADDLMVEFLKAPTRDRQVIQTAQAFGVPWKAKMDVLHDDKIVDLKIVKDFAPVYKDGFGFRPWIEAWGYDIQGAVYQYIERQNSGRKKPFYIVAATKERVPDIAVIEIPQHILDAALEVVKAKIDRFDLIKTGEIKPKRCEKCDYCKATKVLTEPMIYEIEEA